MDILNLNDDSNFVLENNSDLELNSLVFNLNYENVYSSSIEFETKINSKELGGEQRFPMKIYPIRRFTLTFNKSRTLKEEFENFFKDVLGQGNSFSFVWDTAKGGNGNTYICYLDMDTLKETYTQMGYVEKANLSFYAIDKNTYSPPSNFDFYHKADYDTETQFKTLVDSTITAQNARRSLWSTPKRRWVLKFEKTAENRKLIEAFYISKRGKFRSFSWQWAVDRGGDGNYYNVRFDTDNLDLKMQEYGYSEFEIALQEVFPSGASAELEKDEIVPRRLLKLELSTGDVRILENDTLDNLTYGGETYIGAPLDIADIKRNDNTEVMSIGVTLSNVNQAFSGIIGTSGDVITGSPIKVYLVFLNTATNAIISGLDRELLVGKCNNLSMDLQDCKIDIEIDLGGYDKSCPRMTYGVACQWTRFKDVRCGYTGTETTCDRTLTRCKELGNIENFGGNPSLPAEQVIRAF